MGGHQRGEKDDSSRRKDSHKRRRSSRSRSRSSKRTHRHGAASRKEDKRRGHAHGHSASSSSSSSPPPRVKAALNARRAVVPVSANLTSVSTVLESSSGKRTFLPAPLLLDAQGREIDGTGRVITTSYRLDSTLKANQNRYLAKLETLKAASVAADDGRIRSSNRSIRKERGLKFRMEGSIIKKAEALRAQELRREIADRQRQRVSETSSEPAPTIISESDHFVPGLEWWESPFLEPGKREDFKGAKDLDSTCYSYSQLKVDNWENIGLTQIPAAIACPQPKVTNKALPLKLTREEQKKAKRIQKMARLREQQELIQVGLIPAPEPKLKISNMMALFKDEAVANPSLIEMKVQEQVSQRMANHQKRNEERKLTRMGKTRKILNKNVGDISSGKYCAVFRVTDLSGVQHRFKVDVNANQFCLKGRVALCPSLKLNMVLVEGTEKAVKKYIKLMTQRIDWNKYIEDEHPPEEPNHCYVVWQGSSKDLKLENFQIKEFSSGTNARETLEMEGLAQYWDMVRNFVPKEF